MISANELRIGNWIDLKNNGFIKVEADSIGDIVNNPAIFNPIPITPEILEKCGFEYDASYDVPKVQKGSFILWGYENEFGANFGHIEQLDVSVRYLHQLQNLYYSLTGEELNVQL